MSNIFFKYTFHDGQEISIILKHIVALLYNEKEKTTRIYVTSGNIYSIPSPNDELYNNLIGRIKNIQ